MKTHSKVFGILLSVLFVSGAGAEAISPPPTSLVQEIPLWPAAAPGVQESNGPEQTAGEIPNRSFSHVVRPTLTAYLSANPNGAAVLVVPGGGYTKVVFDKEGVEIARWFNTLGIDAYVLKYRLPLEPANGLDAAFQDAQRAMRLVRSGAFAREYGHQTDAKRIGVIGFSAGGHVAGVLGTYWDHKFYDAADEADGLSARPDFMILGYPSIFLRRDLDYIPQTERFWQMSSPYPFDGGLSASTPEAFVFVGDGDTRLPYQRAVRAAAALQQAGVPVELHVFARAPHGFALRGTGPEKAWPELCAAWLKARGIIP